MAEIKISGDKDLQRMHERLRRTIKQGIVGPGLRVGAARILKEQKSVLRKWGQGRPRTGKKRTNAIALLLGRPRLTRRGGILSYYTALPTRAALAGKGISSKNGYLPTALEYGFKARKTKLGNFTGANYIRGGFDKAWREAYRKISAKIGQGLERAAKKK